MTCRETASKKIMEMPKEQVSKILIFMAGMEAERGLESTNKNESKQEEHQELVVMR